MGSFVLLTYLTQTPAIETLFNNQTKVSEKEPQLNLH